MKKSPWIVQALLIVALTTPMLNASNDSHSKKTFLSTRPSGVNLPLEYTIWHDHVYRKKAKTNHTSLQFAGFYQESNKGEGQGKYFGIGNGTNKFTIGPAGAGIDLDKRFLVHGAKNLAGTVSLTPKVESFGCLVQLFQDFDLPFGSIFITASLPFAHVSRNMDLQVANGSTDFSVEDFFAGRVEQTAAADLQAALTHAKIDGRRSATGLADADLQVGFRVVDKAAHHVYLNIGLTIPAGNRVRGEYLFEPVYGNGSHTALGFGLDAGVDAWKNDHAKLRALFAADYRYLFEGTEHRTVGIKGKPLNHYFLAAHLGQKDKALFPAANELTQALRIKPGSQMEMMAMLSFLSSRFVIDAGYNLFWKDQESAWVKRWKDNDFYIAKTTYNTNAINAFAATDGTVVNLVDLDIDAVKTPSLFTHKLFAGLGYTCMVTRTFPLSLGFGADYEFAVTNADIEQWGVWFKLAGSF
ncbi:hypothetical protein JST56_00920 [Candidatus Dependentiae bacterium]|jgi:hypothetical protein|nr:hypothetical protein [Candidatus Dependentiae bacterium]